MDISNLIHRPRRLQDHERPHPILWWLAGGRVRRESPGMGVPTAATLRERRRVEVQNREKVGFWGTVAGIRSVKQTQTLTQLAEVRDRIAPASGASKVNEEAGKRKEGPGAKEQNDDDGEKAKVESPVGPTQEAGVAGEVKGEEGTGEEANGYSGHGDHKGGEEATTKVVENKDSEHGET